MATYKLIQDIEAEDHILGPLTLRQFIFALIAVFLYYICFLSITKKVYFMLPVFGLPALFFTFFALPWGRDQPTEVWFLAKLRFWFKPRRRVWNQSGVKDLVTITVPKKIEPVRTDGLTQGEVKSRLTALTQTIDSRGWAIKHVNTFGPQPLTTPASDRLIDIDNLPQEVPGDDLAPEEDMLDATSNPIARQFDAMITQTSQNRHQQLVDEVSDLGESAVSAQVRPPAGDWFMGQASTQPADGTMQLPAPVQAAPPPVQPAASDPVEEAALSANLKAQAASHPAPYGHMRTMRPVGQPPANHVPAVSDNASTTVTTPSDPAIISLANNNDLNVATLAREARKARGGKDQPPDDEVVISLR